MTHPKDMELAGEVERCKQQQIKQLETVLMLLNGDDNQIDVVKTYALNKLKSLSPSKEKYDTTKPTTSTIT